MESDRLSNHSADLLCNPDNRVWASSVSIAELRIKQSIGKVALPDDFATLVDETGFENLPFNASHAHWLSRLALHHRDPFDRMIIAQAIDEGLTIITSDSAFASYPVSVLKN